MFEELIDAHWIKENLRIYESNLYYGIKRERCAD